MIYKCIPSSELVLSREAVKSRIFDAFLESMKQSAEKKLDALVPLPLTHSIHGGLRSYEGTQLVKQRLCSHCGESGCHKHDTLPWRFAVLITEDGFEDVTVSV